MPKFPGPDSNFYGGKTTFGGANLRKNIRRLQTTPYSALSNVRSIEAKPSSVNRNSFAALNGDSHLSSRTKRVLECLEKTAILIRDSKAPKFGFSSSSTPSTLPAPVQSPSSTTTNELPKLKEKDVVVVNSSKPATSPVVNHEKPPEVEAVSLFEQFKRKRLAQQSSKWTCQCCFVDNEVTDDKCSACEEPNPEMKKTTSTVTPAPLTPFKFGAPQIVSAALPSSSNIPKFTFSIPSTPSTTTNELPKLKEKDVVVVNSSKPATSPVVNHEKPPEVEAVSLFEQFKRKRLAQQSSKWTCQCCFVDNEVTDDKCSACEEPNPEMKKTTSTVTPAPLTPFKFGAPQILSAALPSSSNIPKFTFSTPSTPPTTTTEFPKSKEKDNDIVDNNKPAVSPTVSQKKPPPEMEIVKPTPFSFGQSSTNFATGNASFKFGQPAVSTVSQVVTIPSFGTVTKQVSSAQPSLFPFGQSSTKNATNTKLNFSQAVPAIGQPVSVPSFGAAAQPLSSQSTSFAFGQSSTKNAVTKQVSSAQPSLFSFGQSSTNSAVGNSGFNFGQTAVNSVGQGVTVPSFGAPTQPPAPSAQPASFSFGQASTKSATNTGFNFSQAAPAIGQPVSTPSFGTASQPLSSQPTPFAFGQSSTKNATNTGLNFSQAVPAIGQPVSVSSFGAAAQPPVSSAQPSLFSFGQSSTNSAVGNSGFNFGQTAVNSVGQGVTVPSFGAPTQPPAPSAQPTSFSFGQASTKNATNTGFNFSQAAPAIGQPVSTPSFGTAAQPLSSQTTPFAFGQSSTNTGNSGFNFGQAAVRPVGQAASAPSFGSLFGAAITQPAAPPVIPAFGSTAAFPSVAAPQANSGFKFNAEPTMNFSAFSAPAPAALDGQAANMFAFTPSDPSSMPINRQIKKAKRRLK